MTVKNSKALALDGHEPVPLYTQTDVETRRTIPERIQNAVEEAGTPAQCRLNRYSELEADLAKLRPDGRETCPGEAGDGAYSIN